MTLSLCHKKLWVEVRELILKTTKTRTRITVASRDSRSLLAIKQLEITTLRTLILWESNLISTKETEMSVINNQHGEEVGVKFRTSRRMLEELKVTNRLILGKTQRVISSDHDSSLSPV